MKILVGCPQPESALQELQALAADVVYEPELTAAQLEGLIRDVAVLVVRRTRVSPEIIAAGRSLQLIVRAGTDVGNIAIDAASAAGIFVCNCPHKDALAIAELTIGLLVALDRRLLARVSAVREGRLDEPPPAEALGLAGRTLGLMGLGPVERETARRARAFGLNVLVWSPTLTPERAAAANVRFCAWPRELARQSDMVAVFARRQQVVELLVDREFLENMRHGAYLVYIGHPAALDEVALAEIAAQRNLRVAYDIYDPQSTGAGLSRVQSRLQLLPDVIGTHHLADRTSQAYQATAQEVVRVIRQFLVCGEVVNCVNLLEHGPATWQMVLRLRDTIGVLASVLDRIREDGINVEEISSRVFTGAQAGCCIIALNERPSADALRAIRQTDGVLHCELRALV